MVTRLPADTAVFKVGSGVGDENTRSFLDHRVTVVDRKEKFTGMIILDPVEFGFVVVCVFIVRTATPAAEKMFRKKIHISS